MAQPANAERIIQLQAQRFASQLADLGTELALTTEALERAQARIDELETDLADGGGTDAPPAAKKPSPGKAAPDA